MYISTTMIIILLIWWSFSRKDYSALVAVGVVFFVKMALAKIIIAGLVGVVVYLAMKLMKPRFESSMMKRALLPVKEVKQKRVEHKQTSATWYADEISKLVGSVKK